MDIIIGYEVSLVCFVLGYLGQFPFFYSFAAIFVHNVVICLVNITSGLGFPLNPWQTVAWTILCGLFDLAGYVHATYVVDIKPSISRDVDPHLNYLHIGLALAMMIPVFIFSKLTALNLYVAIFVAIGVIAVLFWLIYFFGANQVDAIAARNKSATLEDGRTDYVNAALKKQTQASAAPADRRSYGVIFLALVIPCFVITFGQVFQFLNPWLMGYADFIVQLITLGMVLLTALVFWLMIKRN